jgi:hypothetical protein
MAIEAAALSIIDRLIQLLTLKERNREKFFNNFIEPLYRDAEPVAKDYMGLLAELSHRLERAESTDDLIPWLEERRTSYQAVRMKIRALLENPLFAEKPPVNEPTPLLRFTTGIWALMRGGTSLVDSFSDGGGYVRMAEYGYFNHTVLSLLEQMRDVSGVDAIEKSRKEDLLRRVKRQQLVIESAWDDVVRGYAELKQKNL